MRALQILVDGTVQGVGYRAWCRRTATAAGLRGFARNLRDGRVEVFVEGDDDALDAFVAACRRGPAHAVVDDVEVIDRAPRHLRDFVVAADAIEAETV